MVSAKMFIQDGEKDVLSVFGVLLQTECRVGELLLTSKITGWWHAVTITCLAFMERLSSFTLGRVEE